MATKPSIALVPFPVQMMRSPVAMGSSVPAWPICMDMTQPLTRFPIDMAPYQLVTAQGAQYPWSLLEEPKLTALCEMLSLCCHVLRPSHSTANWQEALIEQDEEIPS